MVSQSEPKIGAEESPPKKAKLMEGAPEPAPAAEAAPVVAEEGGTEVRVVHGKDKHVVTVASTDTVNLVKEAARSTLHRPCRQ